MTWLLIYTFDSMIYMAKIGMDLINTHKTITQ